MKCESCNVVVINGLYTHEFGCPDSWRDQILECKWCGSTYKPTERGDRFCDASCADAYCN